MRNNCIIDFYYQNRKHFGSIMHSHKTYQMLYLCQGTIRLEAGEKCYECTAPSLIFIASLEEHRITPLSPTYERYVMSIDSFAAKKVLESHLLTIFSTHKLHFYHYVDVTLNKQEIDYILGIIYREYREKKEDWETSCSIWLNALLDRVYRMNPDLFSHMDSTANQIVLDIQEQLEINLDKKISLQELAAHHYISVSYLSHIFKEFTGYSVQQYRLLFRLSYARQLLAESEEEILEISHLCGFADFSNFCRYFKTKTGMTPNAYRTKYKKKAGK